MNDGKRLMRNSVLTLYLAVALFFGVNRLFAALVNNDAPPWLVSVASFGLAKAAAGPRQERVLQDLALRDFTRLHVNGRFHVEIVGAPQYRLTFTAPDGRALPLQVRQQGDQLWLSGHATRKSATDAVLRIETPALRQVDARLLKTLTLRALQAPQLVVDLNDVPEAHLLQNQVADWTVHADVSAVVQVDRATLAAGKLQTTGEVALRYGE